MNTAIRLKNAFYPKNEADQEVVRVVIHIIPSPNQWRRKTKTKDQVVNQNMMKIISNIVIII